CGVVRKDQRGIGCDGSSVIDCLWPNTKKARISRALNIWSDLFVVVGADLRPAFVAMVSLYLTIELIHHNGKSTG
ncbi:hypothetical protein QLY40_19980, partial [Cronobacter sakazakii]|nr:hypothetical protein [Cronobacter sakazakii]